MHNGVAEPDEETLAVLHGVETLLAGEELKVSRDRLDAIPEWAEVTGELFAAGGYAFILERIRAAGTKPEDVANNWLKEVDPSEVSEEAYTAWRDYYFNVPASTLNERLLRVEDFRGRMLQQMTHDDVLVSAVNPHPAPVLPPPGDHPISDWSYTEVFDVTGWPAGVIRAGTSSEGRPIGVQIVANPWREDIVLAVMAFIEGALPDSPRPALALD